MKKIIHVYSLHLTVMIILGTLLGCAAPKPVNPRVIDTIIIQNNTGEYIQEVALSENFSSPSAQVGSISPFPVNAQQVYERPTRATRLPKVLQIQWTTGANRLYKKEISIEALLLSAPQKQHTSLILDFRVNADIYAYTGK